VQKPLGAKVEVKPGDVGIHCRRKRHGGLILAAASCGYCRI